MRNRTRRLAADQEIKIVRVNNLRYGIEGYIERRHPEFSYDTSLNGFMSDFITAVIERDMGYEYRIFSKWERVMLVYEEAAPDVVKESIAHVFKTIQRHLAYEVSGFRSGVQWEWLNAREIEIVLIGRRL